MSFFATKAVAPAQVVRLLDATFSPFVESLMPIDGDQCGSLVSSGDTTYPSRFIDGVSARFADVLVEGRAVKHSFWDRHKAKAAIESMSVAAAKSPAGHKELLSLAKYALNGYQDAWWQLQELEFHDPWYLPSGGISDDAVRSLGVAARLGNGDALSLLLKYIGEGDCAEAAAQAIPSSMLNVADGARKNLILYGIVPAVAFVNSVNKKHSNIPLNDGATIIAVHKLYKLFANEGFVAEFKIKESITSYFEKLDLAPLVEAANKGAADAVAALMILTNGPARRVDAALAMYDLKFENMGEGLGNQLTHGNKEWLRKSVVAVAAAYVNFNNRSAFALLSKLIHTLPKEEASAIVDALMIVVSSGSQKRSAEAEALIRSSALEAAADAITKIDDSRISLLKHKIKKGVGDFQTLKDLKVFADAGNSTAKNALFGLTEDDLARLMIFHTADNSEKLAFLRELTLQGHKTAAWTLIRIMGAEAGGNLLDYSAMEMFPDFREMASPQAAGMIASILEYKAASPVGAFLLNTIARRPELRPLIEKILGFVPINFLANS